MRLFLTHSPQYIVHTGVNLFLREGLRLEPLQVRIEALGLLPLFPLTLDLGDNAVNLSVSVCHHSFLPKESADDLVAIEQGQASRLAAWINLQPVLMGKQRSSPQRRLSDCSGNGGLALVIRACHATHTAWYSPGLFNGGQQSCMLAAHMQVL